LREERGDEDHDDSDCRFHQGISREGDCTTSAREMRGLAVGDRGRNVILARGDAEERGVPRRMRLALYSATRILANKRRVFVLTPP
jgi:hypothetical protein